MNSSKECKQFTVDRLKVKVFRNRLELGQAAAADAAAKMRELLAEQPQLRIIFAAAPSQNEFLDALGKAEGIDWSRVVAFHMDDYLGLPDKDARRFSSYLKEHIFTRVPLGEVHFLLNPNSPLTQKVPAAAILAAIHEECERYSRLLKTAPIDLVFMGIGENGHIAFNDPPVARFDDPELVKLVELEERCRIQQVHDGCFETLAAVPTHALTLTIPALFSARHLYCMVPGPTKRAAVARTIHEAISTQCPASILRQHNHACLYADFDSAGDGDI